MFKFIWGSLKFCKVYKVPFKDTYTKSISNGKNEAVENTEVIISYLLDNIINKININNIIDQCFFYAYNWWLIEAS